MTVLKIAQELSVTELEFVPKFGTLYPEFFFSSLNHPKLQSMEAQVSFALSLGLSNVWVQRR